MNLYKVPSKPFEEDWGEMTATWVGQEGRGLRLILVPIVTYGDAPKDNAWGVIGSSTGRPKIKSNSDPTPGWIVRLSSFTGESPAVGSIFVAKKCLNDILLLAHGRGTNRNGKGLWQEAIFICPGEAEFYIQATNPPDRLVRVSREEVHEEHVTDTDIYYSDSASWTRADHSSVPRWKVQAELVP